MGDTASTDGNATTSGQNELLYCWACHADNSGTLREPGPITAEYGAAPFPDLSGSNICVACHAGREGGESILSPPTDDNDFTDKEFVNSHYLAAGGIIYIEIGYEFTGQNYSNPIPYQHGDATFNDNGPCVGCHMETDTSHLFLPVKKDESGEVIELTSFEQTCSDCHSGPQELIDLVNELEEGFTAALAALEVELANNGYVFLGGYPYFANKDWTSANDPSGKDNMGAAFNYNLLSHEPCAYVHNLQYAKKLIYDSIDFLDDGTLNSSVEATLGSGSAFDFLAGTRP